jgi:hypothetical protein
MSRVVFLLEERSMKVLLEGLLPRLMPNLPFLCVAHEGKQDLEKSIPRKLLAWGEPGVAFVVVRDNDGRDCMQVKRHIASLCEDAGRADTLVRLACQELEAWYFGEPDALAKAYGRPALGDISGKAKYRDPDVIQKPSAELEALVPEFQKVSGARRMGAVLSESGNRSRSFQVFLEGVRRLGAAMAQTARAQEISPSEPRQIELFEEK